MPDHTPSTFPSGQILTNVQALRGVAVILVLLGHILQPRDFPWIYPFVSYFHCWAYSGVDIFFVLSGFVIAGVATRGGASASCSERLRSALAFLVKRFVRIYPLYWVVLGASFAASSFVNIEPNIPHMSPLRIVTTLTRDNWLVPQAWSLYFEVYFYVCVFIVLALLPKRFFLGIAMLMLLNAVIYFSASDPNALPFPVSGLVFEFGFGCAVSFFVTHGQRRHAVFFLCLGLAGFAIGAELTHTFGLLQSGLRTISFGLGSACLLYAAAATELRGEYRAGTFIRRIGDASYSIYLWHFGMFKVLETAIGRLDIMAAQPHMFTVLLIIVVTTLFCLAWYQWAERPFLLASKRLVLAAGTGLRS